MSDPLRVAAAEVVAAYREHQAMLAVGGHEPQRLDGAVDELWRMLQHVGSPTQEAG